MTFARIEELKQHVDQDVTVRGWVATTRSSGKIAFVVLRDALDAAPENLKAFCAARLSAHKVPATFVYKNELPRLPGRDKVDRRVLHDEAAGAGTDPANPRAEPMAASEDT